MNKNIKIISNDNYRYLEVNRKNKFNIMQVWLCFIFVQCSVFSTNINNKEDGKIAEAKMNIKYRHILIVNNKQIFQYLATKFPREYYKSYSEFVLEIAYNLHFPILISMNWKNIYIYFKFDLFIKYVLLNESNFIF